MKHLTLIDKAFLLKRTPLFSSLDLDLLLAIADKLGSMISDRDDFIFSTGQEANRMYFIVKGMVEIRTPNHEVICQLESGQFFGEESLFNGKPRGYEVFTLAETHVLTLSRSNLYTIISECPSVALGFLEVYTSAVEFRPVRTLQGDS